MNGVLVHYDTLVNSREVLGRQEGRATALESYLRAHTDISDSTGALLALLSPLDRRPGRDPGAAQRGAHP